MVGSDRQMNQQHEQSLSTKQISSVSRDMQQWTDEIICCIGQQCLLWLEITVRYAAKINEVSTEQSFTCLQLLFLYKI